jgi:hypothetical protein
MLIMRAGGDPGAEGFAGPVDERTALVEGPVVDQKLMGELRTTDHVGTPGAQSDLDQITAGRERGEEGQGVSKQR